MEAVAVEAEVVVEEEVVEVERLLQEEEPTQMRNCWEENPNTLKETDGTSIGSLRTSSPDTGHIVWTPRGRRVRKSGAKPVVEA